MEFEQLMADYYRDLGFAVEHCGTGGAAKRYDGGIDLKLRRDDEYVLVQCKHKTADQVTHNPVHELLGIMVNESATGAILVTSGEFTDAARRAGARHGHVQLIDGLELRSLLGTRLEELSPAAAEGRADSLNGMQKDKDWSLDQVESRWREPRAKRPRSSNEDALITVIGWGASIIALFWVVSWIGSPSVAHRTVSASTSPSAPLGSKGPAEVESSTSSRLAPRQTILPVSVPPTGAWSGDIEVITPPEPVAISAAEQARRDAETRRVLDHLNVPEMTHFSYSPLDQNADKPAEPSNQAATPQ